MSVYVVDSSAAIKWFTQEINTAEAVRLRDVVFRYMHRTSWTLNWRPSSGRRSVVKDYHVPMVISSYRYSQP